jgi:pimeloyl-ACP methyl ester carboxylesterase
MSQIGHSKRWPLASRLCAVVASAFALLANATVSPERSGQVDNGKPLDRGARTIEKSDWHDPSPHTVLTVPVAPDVSLEVLDWGGPGRAIVLLAGLGNTAHIFDDFAPKLARSYHVYGITRRGFGASSTPPSGYTSDRLAADVLAVVEFLKLHRPILVGHSFAGEELNILGIEHPGNIAGLVYLDAAYDRTTVSSARWNTLAAQTRPPPPSAEDQRSYSVLRAWYLRTMHVDTPEAELRADSMPSPIYPTGVPRTPPSVYRAILSGVGKPDYRGIHLPALAIYAVPRSVEDIAGFGSAPQAAIRELFRLEREQVRVNAANFRSGITHARVIEIPGARHLLFLSNQDDVLRDIRKFVASVR